jgi:hypothetical protein
MNSGEGKIEVNMLLPTIQTLKKIISKYIGFLEHHQY